jgi:hypothetical protein
MLCGVMRRRAMSCDAMRCHAMPRGAMRARIQKVLVYFLSTYSLPPSLPLLADGVHFVSPRIWETMR